METSGNASESDLYVNYSSSESSSSNITNFRVGGVAGNENNSMQGDFGMLRMPSLNFFQSPLSFVAYSGSQGQSNSDSCVETSGNIISREISIRITSSGESEEHSVQSQRQELDVDDVLDENVGSVGRGGGMEALDDQLSGRGDVGGAGERVPLVTSSPLSIRRGTERESDGNSDSSYRSSYDIQQVARWIEQLLPFSLLLLVVFIRQHLQDTMMRQAAMAFKCFLLIYYKNGKDHNFRRQGQMLTLLEYALLLYRALLPTPVWYRFFLNNGYGSLFSSLTTGLYLTFKLMFTVKKVQCFLAAIRALSQKEVHYGGYATLEQVNAAGDLCAICQEKMHAPVLLHCKHIFCEDCVSEWFERERTCPLCRALVKPAGLPTFGDGSTSLFFQLF